MRKAPILVAAAAGLLIAGGRELRDYTAGFLSGYGDSPKPDVSLDGGYRGDALDRDGDKKIPKPKTDSEGWIYPDEVDKNPDGSYAYNFCYPEDVYRAFVEGGRVGDKQLLGKIVIKPFATMSLIRILGDTAGLALRPGDAKKIFNGDEDVEKKARRIARSIVSFNYDLRGDPDLKSDERDNFYTMVFRAGVELFTEGLMTAEIRGSKKRTQYDVRDLEESANQLTRYRIVSKTADVPKSKKFQRFRKVSKDINEDCDRISRFFRIPVENIKDARFLEVEQDFGDFKNTIDFSVVKRGESWEYFHDDDNFKTIRSNVSFRATGF